MWCAHNLVYFKIWGSWKWKILKILYVLWRCGLPCGHGFAQDFCALDFWCEFAGLDSLHMYWIALIGSIIYACPRFTSLCEYLVVKNVWEYQWFVEHVVGWEKVTSCLMCHTWLRKHKAPRICSSMWMELTVGLLSLLVESCCGLYIERGDVESRGGALGIPFVLNSWNGMQNMRRLMCWFFSHVRPHTCSCTSAWYKLAALLLNL